VVFTENDNADTMLNRADKLLYVAKKAGKNMVSS
jgi:PleD family two-component response regulator